MGVRNAARNGRAREGEALRYNRDGNGPIGQVGDRINESSAEGTERCNLDGIKRSHRSR